MATSASSQNMFCEADRGKPCLHTAPVRRFAVMRVWDGFLQLNKHTPQRALKSTALAPKQRSCDVCTRRLVLRGIPAAECLRYAQPCCDLPSRLPRFVTRLRRRHRGGLVIPDMESPSMQCVFIVLSRLRGSAPRSGPTSLDAAGANGRAEAPSRPGGSSLLSVFDSLDFSDFADKLDRISSRGSVVWVAWGVLCACGAWGLAPAE